MSHVWNRLPGVAALLLLTIGLFYAGGAFAQTPEAAPALLAHQSALELDGAGTAWLVLLPLPPVSEVQSGGLPIDIVGGKQLWPLPLLQRLSHMIGKSTKTAKLPIAKR